jgi:hypothetical protein
LAQRSRKRGQRDAPARPGAATPRPPRKSSEQRNAEARARLEPLAPGERPGAVTVAAIAAALVGVLNVALYLAGVRVEHTTFAGTVGVGAVLLLAAAGMWRARYWAVLGFEVLLGLTGVVAALSLLVASTLAGAVRSVLVLALSGVLFWKLIRAMARIQMPDRRPPRSSS